MSNKRHLTSSNSDLTLYRPIFQLLRTLLAFALKEQYLNNRQLAKLLSGFVTGQIMVAKVVVTVAAQSLATCMGKLTSSCTRAQSFLPKLRLSVWLFLDLSFAPNYDADCRPLVCFGPTNRRSKNIRSRSFRSAMSETSEFALAFIESLAKLATASPFFMFFQH